MKRLVVIDKNGKKKYANIPDWQDGSYASAWDSSGDGGPSNTTGSIVINPIFYNSTTSMYYTLNVVGTLGNETLEIDTSVLTSPTNIVLYDVNSGMYYTLNIVGTLGNEVIEIDPTLFTNITPVQLFNSTTGDYYNLSVVGTLGNETLQLDQI